jgi:hypothetical protein
MRILLMPLTLIVIALVAYLVVLAVRAPGRSQHADVVRDAEWTATTEMKDGNTIVIVHKVADRGGDAVELARQIIAEIPDGAPDWEQRYHEAMAEARARASALQIESE